MKKLTSVCLSLAMVLSLAACGGGTNTDAPKEEKKAAQEAAAASSEIVTGMIAYTFGTQSFSDDILTGLQQAQDELGIPHHELEIADVTETATGFRTLIQQGCNFLVASTAEYCDGMLEVAAEYPDVNFLYLAEYLPDAPANVISFYYNENEAAFLAGALGGLLTESNKIGAVLAVTDPIQIRYQNGYMAGAKAVNPDCEVMVTFTNSYSDTNVGYEHANAMYSKGCDYVSCFAGACNLGVFKAAEEAGDGKYCFGAANGQFDKAPDKIIASVVKPVNETIVGILKEGQATGNFANVASSLGLKEKGVVLMYTTNETLLSQIPEEDKAVIEDLTAKIISGELKVPANESEFAEFNYTYEK